MSEMKTPAASLQTPGDLYHIEVREKGTEEWLEFTDKKKEFPLTEDEANRVVKRLELRYRVEARKVPATQLLVVF